MVNKLRRRENLTEEREKFIQIYELLNNDRILERYLIDGDSFGILTAMSTNRHTYFGWVLAVDKYLKQCNLDDILCWVDASELSSIYKQ